MGSVHHWRTGTTLCMDKPGLDLHVDQQGYFKQGVESLNLEQPHMEYPTALAPEDKSSSWPANRTSMYPSPPPVTASAQTPDTGQNWWIMPV